MFCCPVSRQHPGIQLGTCQRAGCWWHRASPLLPAGPQSVTFVQKYVSGHPLISEASSGRENATYTSEKLQRFGWVFRMTTIKKSCLVMQNQAEQLLAAHKHPTPSQSTAPAFPPGLLPLSQPLPAPQHRWQTCSRKTLGTPELGEARAGYLIPKKQVMLQRNHWSNETGSEQQNFITLSRPHPIPAPVALCWEGQGWSRASPQGGWRRGTKEQLRLSHEPMVGAWSQVPCRGQLSGWGHRSGKARELLEFPSAASPLSRGNWPFLRLQTPPPCQGEHWGCVWDWCPSRWEASWGASACPCVLGTTVLAACWGRQVVPVTVTSLSAGLGVPRES